MNDESGGKKNPSFREKVRDDFPSFYLFHQVFSEPVCRRIHPLFRRATQRRYIMSRGSRESE